MAKTVLQEAIAEAKQLRDAAIQNAYKQLEESLTPSIKEMLASKLEEEEEVTLEEEEEQLEEATDSGFKEIKPKSIKEESEEEEASEDEEAAEEESEEASEDEEAAEEESEEASEDTKLADITLGDLKDLIADLIAAGAGTAAPEGNLGVDMEPGDVEGLGDEEAPIEDPVAEPGLDVPGETEEEDDEIDISEILKELEEEDSQELQEQEEDKEDKSQELQEALETIKTLQQTVVEVNLLNSKLLYTTRVLQNSRLSESKKAFIIQKLDKATSPKVVKSIFTELTEGIKATATKKKRIVENKRARQAASKPVGTSTAPKQEVIAESTDVVKRMQYLAGIITD